jgi:hypothetical protein
MMFDRSRRVPSPYFIFIRHSHGFSDEDLLTRFHLGSYQRSLTEPLIGPRAILANDENWTMLADDLLYTLWHMKLTRPAIEEIAQSHEVFACSEGDCDRSFDYVHYRDGRLARKYTVSSPHFTDRVVVEDVGATTCEELQLLKNDGENIGIQLAERMGIKTRFTSDDLRIYVP